jgi:Flp pilus assembly protein protease CpaA
LRIVPVLLVWALLMAAATVAAGGLISLGVALTTYFSGAVLLVIWLERRARRYADER